MRNKKGIYQDWNDPNDNNKWFGFGKTIGSALLPDDHDRNSGKTKSKDLPEILFITSYPPRVCGIATYSLDLIKTLMNKFSESFSIKVCALESGNDSYDYPEEVKYILDASLASAFTQLADTINQDGKVKFIVIEHEFGFFRAQKQAFLEFLTKLLIPKVIVFHTVLPAPDEELKQYVQNISAACEAIIVMTKNSAGLLAEAYEVSSKMITVIPHGTHLVPHLNKEVLKRKYKLSGKKILSTFGLLSSGKSIETTLCALPGIIKEIPDVVFLVIGKTHPEVVKSEGEEYRNSLELIVRQYNLQSNVRFIDKYLVLPDLLEFLQLTDIYLFTTKDPNQAVSGTFAYAMSCACPIISTPIPHAREVLTDETGIIIDFGNSKQLADGVIRLFNDEPLRKNMSTNTLQKIVSTAWENSAIAHALLFESILKDNILLKFDLPTFKLNQLKQMTNDTGIIQFSKINQPDITSGYTLDDNARALMAFIMHYELTKDEKSIPYIRKYLRFIKHCQQTAGNFLNYIDNDGSFSEKNKSVNLDDANGRAVWALGYTTSKADILPKDILDQATEIFEKAVPGLEIIQSTRAMAFIIKGIYYQYTGKTCRDIYVVKVLSDRLVQMFRHESDGSWTWFESYLTYANSILPEAMLYAWLMTGETNYKEVARSSFSFLLSQTFKENWIEVISNKNWLQKGQEPEHFGEQPIDVAYTIMTLSKFYDVFKDESYRIKMILAFNWFLGNNRLHQIIYNPCTGGCYDGLEENHVNLNQGAESTVSYHLARFTLGKYNKHVRAPFNQMSICSDRRVIKESAHIQFAKSNSVELNSYGFTKDSSEITSQIPDNISMCE
jgi:glycosyltransferase involved in cell wall biosynthesis